MEIEEIRNDKKSYLQLLLLADEQESMIDRYLNDSTMYLLKDKENIIGECVVQDASKGIIEIKNIAIRPEFQGKGNGRKLIDFIGSKYHGKYSIIQVGTGDSPLTIPFYEKCGFKRFGVIKNFFIDNYDHEIMEGGVKLIDMIILRKNL